MNQQCDRAKYAETYLKERVEVFRKDMRICLTADSDFRHAYMPALLTCTALLDLLGCLYQGELRPKGHSHVLKYANDFLDNEVYPRDSLALLWQMYRHKVAHTMQPYGVFDSHSDTHQSNPLLSQPRMWVTWKICASNFNPPIHLIEKPGVLTRRPPWPCQYTHRCKISLYRFKVDIPASIVKKNGYVRRLKWDKSALDRFFMCMEEIFPRSKTTTDIT